MGHHHHHHHHHQHQHHPNNHNHHHQRCSQHMASNVGIQLSHSVFTFLRRSHSGRNNSPIAITKYTRCRLHNPISGGKRPFSIMPVMAISNEMYTMNSTM